jgi:hypothetical protein
MKKTMFSSLRALRCGRTTAERVQLQSVQAWVPGSGGVRQEGHSGPPDRFRFSPSGSSDAKKSVCQLFTLIPNILFSGRVVFPALDGPPEACLVSGFGPRSFSILARRTAPTHPAIFPMTAVTLPSLSLQQNKPPFFRAVLMLASMVPGALTLGCRHSRPAFRPVLWRTHAASLLSAECSATHEASSNLLSGPFCAARLPRPKDESAKAAHIFESNHRGNKKQGTDSDTVVRLLSVLLQPHFGRVADELICSVPCLQRIRFSPLPDLPLVHVRVLHPAVREGLAVRDPHRPSTCWSHFPRTGCPRVPQGFSQQSAALICDEWPSARRLAPPD